MVPARFAVFFVALLMAGVHVAHAQEGTGDQKAFEEQNRGQRRGTRAVAPANTAAPIVVSPTSAKAGEVLVTNKPAAATASGPRVEAKSGQTVDTIMQRLSTPQAGVAASVVAANAAGGTQPVPSNVAAVDNIMLRLGAQPATAAALLASPPIATPSDATVDAIRERLAASAHGRTHKSPLAREVLVANAPAKPESDEPAASAAGTLPAPAKPATTLVASIDLATQRLTVSEHGKKLHSWAISSGARDFPTPIGNFRAEWMAKVWNSRKYDDAPMPHSVFFKNGAAIHGTQSTGALGRPVSHGCVRLAPANAEMFFKLVQKHGLQHSKIAIFGTPNFAPVAAKRPAVHPGSVTPAIALNQRAIARPGSLYSGYAPQAATRVWPGDAPAAPGGYYRAH